MRALKLVGQENVRIVEHTLPEKVPEGHARIRITHVTLNHLDLFGYRGMAFSARELPIIVAAEGVGCVVNVADSHTAIEKGEKVAIYPNYFCGVCKSCIAGKENLCEKSGGIVGFHKNGLAADYVDLPTKMLVKVQDNVLLEEASCAPITLSTVHHMLFDNAKLQAGETILVHAGGSGIGSTAIRMAKAVGAVVLTTVGTEEKAEKAKLLGADYVINYRTKRFLREVRNITAKQGVNVVFEHVGTETWSESILSLCRGGRLVTCGSTTGVDATMNLFTVFNQQLHIYGSFGAPIDGVRKSLELIAENKVKPVIDTVFDMQDFEKGIERLRNRDVFGKIILRVGE